MKIFDCFMYFDEEMILDLRLNILNKYVDYFVIVESCFNHKGEKRDLCFNIKNFKKFEKKIKYVIADYNDDYDIKNHIGGESVIEKHQRNKLIDGIEHASQNDLIILSDSDEIPDLKKINEIKKNKKFIAFSQKMFMYKLNLQSLDENNWIGSKVTFKKHITSMQDLRDLKFKNYPFWRVDKYNQEIINGGWHFSFLQTPQQILTKIKSFSHGEYNKGDINEKNIQEKILKNEDIFDRNTELKKIAIDKSFPDYIINNQGKLSNWII